ncbi:hypothetical protein FJT64_020234 [Amphibalanus amphitrite]|uniref:MAM domain-containing protein n=1 Tax=Amphibalanus amphitrite TaxID=1232801 RepID=A0A6A4X141_AMPAM|nr:hypothetical protein FJT64_020234 [Amphibalanus amphitrite]
MTRVTLTLTLLAVSAALTAADYCEDFESGDSGQLWSGNPLDQAGTWEVRLASELRRQVPDLPAEPSGRYLAWVAPLNFSSTEYVHGRLVTTAALPYPAGSSISFRYWIRSQYVSSAALDVRFVVGTAEQPTPFLDLSDQSGPTNDQWRTVTAQIPASSQPVKLSIFGGRGLDQLDQVAIDDITVHAPPTQDPAVRCVCSLGTHDHSSDHVFTLVELPPLPAFGCDHEAEHLCEEECHTSRDVLEAAGAWNAQLDGARLGDLACAAWGQDVTDGLVTAMYQHVCDLAEKHTVSFEPHLCCAGGVYVECRWGMARNRLTRGRP